MPRVTKSRTGVAGEAEDEGARPAAPRTAAKAKSTVREYAEALAVAFLLALFIRTFLVQAFKIPSGSMLETLQIGDHILVNKLRYGIRLPGIGKRVVKFQDPRRGDVIVFVYPVDPSKDFIKRVIGEPGDTVEVKHKQVLINGAKIDDPYGQFVEGPGDTSRLTPRDNFGPVTVPPDQVFVMGDNRDRSYDSRFWGFVPAETIVGRAIDVYFSWDGRRIAWERIGKTLR